MAGRGESRRRVKAASSRPAHAGPDTIIQGGKVITCDAGGSVADALAV